MEKSKPFDVTQARDICRRLRDNIRCGICLDSLDDPVVTVCNHQFCRKCVVGIMSKKLTGSCPECRHHLLKRSLRSNNRLTLIIGATKVLAETLEDDVEKQIRKRHLYTSVRTDLNVNEITEDKNSTIRFQENNATSTNVAQPKICNSPKVFVDEESILPSTKPLLTNNVNIRCAFPANTRGEKRKFAVKNQSHTLLSQIDQEQALKDYESKKKSTSELLNFLRDDNLRGRTVESPEDRESVLTGVNCNDSPEEKNEEPVILHNSCLSPDERVEKWLSEVNNKDNEGTSNSPVQLLQTEKSILPSPEIDNCNEIAKDDSSCNEDPYSDKVTSKTSKVFKRLLPMKQVSTTSSEDPEDPYAFVPSQNPIPSKRAKRGKGRAKKSSNVGRMSPKVKTKTLNTTLPNVNQFKRKESLKSEKVFDSLMRDDSELFTNEDNASDHALFVTPRDRTVSREKDYSRQKPSQKPRSKSLNASMMGNQKNVKNRVRKRNSVAAQLDKSEIQEMSDKINAAEDHELNVVNDKRDRFEELFQIKQPTEDENSPPRNKRNSHDKKRQRMEGSLIRSPVISRSNVHYREKAVTGNSSRKPILEALRNEFVGTRDNMTGNEDCEESDTKNSLAFKKRIQTSSTITSKEMEDNSESNINLVSPCRKIVVNETDELEKNQSRSDELFDKLIRVTELPSCSLTKCTSLVKNVTAVGVTNGGEVCETELKTGSVRLELSIQDVCIVAETCGNNTESANGEYTEVELLNNCIKEDCISIGKLSEQEDNHIESFSNDQPDRMELQTQLDVDNSLLQTQLYVDTSPLQTQLYVNSSESADELDDPPGSGNKAHAETSQNKSQNSFKMKSVFIVEPKEVVMETPMKCEVCPSCGREGSRSVKQFCEIGVQTEMELEVRPRSITKRFFEVGVQTIQIFQDSKGINEMEFGSSPSSRREDSFRNDVDVAKSLAVEKVNKVNSYWPCAMPQCDVDSNEFTKDVTHLDENARSEVANVEPSDSSHGGSIVLGSVESVPKESLNFTDYFKIEKPASGSSECSQSRVGKRNCVVSQEFDVVQPLKERIEGEVLREEEEVEEETELKKHENGNLTEKLKLLDYGSPKKSEENLQRKRASQENSQSQLFLLPEKKNNELSRSPFSSVESSPEVGVRRTRRGLASRPIEELLEDDSVSRGDSPPRLLASQDLVPPTPPNELNNSVKLYNRPAHYRSPLSTVPEEDELNCRSEKIDSSQSTSLRKAKKNLAQLLVDCVKVSPMKEESPKLVDCTKVSLMKEESPKLVDCVKVSPMKEESPKLQYSIGSDGTNCEDMDELIAADGNNELIDLTNLEDDEKTPYVKAGGVIWTTGEKLNRLDGSPNRSADYFDAITNDNSEGFSAVSNKSFQENLTNLESPVASWKSNGSRQSLKSQNEEPDSNSSSPLPNLSFRHENIVERESSSEKKDAVRKQRLSRQNRNQSSSTLKYQQNLQKYEKSCGEGNVKSDVRKNQNRSLPSSNSSLIAAQNASLKKRLSLDGRRKVPFEPSEVFASTPKRSGVNPQIEKCQASVSTGCRSNQMTSESDSSMPNQQPQCTPKQLDSLHPNDATQTTGEFRSSFCKANTGTATPNRSTSVMQRNLSLNMKSLSRNGSPIDIKIEPDKMRLLREENEMAVGKKNLSSQSNDSHCNKSTSKLSPLFATPITKMKLNVSKTNANVSVNSGAVTKESTCIAESEKIEKVEKQEKTFSGHSGKRFSFVASGLSLTEMKQTRYLATKLGADFNHRFSKATTHVIMKTTGTLLCDRTLKYFQGVTTKKWIVSFLWVLESLKKGDMLPEEKYEVIGDKSHGIHMGPRRSRRTPEKLLKDYEICCQGDFLELNREDIVNLAEASGASTVLDPTMFNYQSDKQNLIIVQNLSHVAALEEMCRRYQVSAVTRDWLLDSIAIHECRPINHYPFVPKIQSPATLA